MERRDKLCDFDILLPVGGDVAAVLLCFFAYTRLIHHVELSEGDQLLEMIRQEFPSDVDSVVTECSAVVYREQCDEK